METRMTLKWVRSHQDISIKWRGKEKHQHPNVLCVERERPIYIYPNMNVCVRLIMSNRQGKVEMTLVHVW